MSEEIELYFFFLFSFFLTLVDTEAWGFHFTREGNMRWKARGSPG